MKYKATDQIKHRTCYNIMKITFKNVMNNSVNTYLKNIFAYLPLF